jgi:hypothetical protein
MRICILVRYNSIVAAVSYSSFIKISVCLKFYFHRSRRICMFQLIDYIIRSVVEIIYYIILMWVFEQPRLLKFRLFFLNMQRQQIP